MESRPLEHIIKTSGWSKGLDVLQIDVEGAEAIVLEASGLETLKPKMVLFERSHMTSDLSRRIWEILERTYNLY